MSDWITTQEAAKLSGFHPEYVRRLARQGKIGAEKKGRDWWLDQGGKKASSYRGVVVEL